MKTERNWFCSTAYAVVIGMAPVIGLAAGASPAFAQGASPSSNADAAAEADDSRLEDIVVTAQRRQEAAQSVPISITAVSGEALKRGAIDDLQGMTRGVVGIQYDAKSTWRPELFIRGIGTNRSDIGSDPSSGTYVDEIYQPRFADVLTGLVDLDRIEVLRGPQGTLFGRNTIGGAISAYTADPASTFGGTVNASYGNKDYIAAAGTISAPLTENILSRFTVGYRDRDGFMRDTVSGRSDGIRAITLRGKLLFKLSEKAELRLTATHFDSKQDAFLLNPANVPIFLASPVVPQAVDGDRYSGAYTIAGGNRLKNTQVSGRLDLDNDAAKLSVIASFIDFKQSPSHDFDGSGLDSIFYVGHAKSKTYSLEFRLASQDGGIATFDGKMRWVMGAYLFQDKGYELGQFTPGKDSIFAFLFANPQYLDPSAVPTPPFNPGTVRFTDGNDIRSNLKSLAFYGQASYDLTEQLGITIGGRYTVDDRDFVFTGFSDPTKPFPGFPLVPQNYVYAASAGAESFTPKLGIEFKPLRDVLFYGSYSKGFKSGAIQSTAFNPGVAARVTRPEKADAYEIGLKSEFFGNRLRLNIAAFQNKFKDLQVRRVVAINGFATAISENAASSTIKGIEVEASAVPVRGLRLNASYAYLRAKYDTYVVDALAALDFSGNRLPRAPEHRFNVDATYSYRFANDAAIELRAAYNYTGSFFFQPDNLALQKEKGYGLTDVSASLTLPNGTTSIQAWGRNIFSKEYRTYLDPLDGALKEGWSDKATYGITLSQRF